MCMLPSKEMTVDKITLIIMPFKVLKQGNKWKKKKSSLYALPKLNDKICIGMPEMANND